jgi:hypothetical protein
MIAEELTAPEGWRCSSGRHRFGMGEAPHHRRNGEGRGDKGSHERDRAARLAPTKQRLSAMHGRGAAMPLELGFSERLQRDQHHAE